MVAGHSMLCPYEDATLKRCSAAGMRLFARDRCMNAGPAPTATAFA